MPVDEEQVKEFFDEIDTDGSGKLSFEEFDHLLIVLNYNPVLTNFIWFLSNATKHGGITFNKFYKYIAQIAHFDEKPEGIYRAMFKKLDKDNKGEIKKKRVVNFLNEVKFSDSVKQAIDEMDQDGDGVFDYDEFASYVSALFRY